MIKHLFQPPGIQLVMLLIAVLIWFRYRHLSFVLVLAAMVSLWLLSTGPVSHWLMKNLEQQAAYLPDRIPPDARAIVILGTGVLGNTPEYDMEPQPGALLTQRLRYGVKLARETGLPVLVSGGTFHGINEAEVMADFMEEHGVPVKWQEDISKTTRENALGSAQLLNKEGIHKVLLVTHAWHMPRSLMAFKQVALDVIPAPTAHASRRVMPSGWQTWLPNIFNLRKSQLAIHEYAGLLWYRLF
ncbi:YdcF family protein [Sansalvadorimonas sp. 2012CJ34-2]|uniref:YdcF family protein n=1 Tax=Parendozoicomonas callyspongiae TaxID=2942213 RepID=A0ABT0PGL1_9GAMM|nr:YdcF family protein [Sansalvadorimonas sp. 2012CJ34-2]MCL6270396.1 YdcF family protein [Sansalvadorimonas sp. 2012CJ34-2]